MAIYTKTTWVDEVLAGAERFNINDNVGTPIYSNVEIELNTSITTTGTALDAAALNNIETGLELISNIINRRQGAAAPAGTNDWTEIGTTTHALTAVPEIQLGSANAAGFTANQTKDVTVTFPGAFGKPPLVYVQVAGYWYGSSGDGDFTVNVKSVSTTGFTVRMTNLLAVAKSTGIHWLAIGEKA